MKKIRKEYYFIAILLVCFIILTIFVMGNKTSLLDKSAFNSLIKLESNIATKVLYAITNLESTIGFIVLLITK